MANKKGRPKGTGLFVAGSTNAGHIVRSARLQAKKGLADIAKALRVSVQFISNIEHGRAPLPPTMVKAAAKVLGVPLSAVKTAVLSDYAERRFRG